MVNPNVAQVRGWLEEAGPWHSLLMLTVKDGAAASGASQACLTWADRDEAVRAFEHCYGWSSYVPALPCPGSLLSLWSSIGQVLVKSWSSVGQVLVKSWSSVGQVLVK